MQSESIKNKRATQRAEKVSTENKVENTQEVNPYGKEYFDGEGSNYKGYEDQPHFVQMAHYIKEKTYPNKGKVLEVGCAKGFLVKHLHEVNVDAYGCDISEYAVEKSPVKHLLKVGSLTNLPYKDREFEWIISFDTLEHLKPEEVDKAIQEMCRVASKQFHSITTPEYSVGEDKTHYSMHPIAWWREKFEGIPNIFLKHAGEA